jgi:excisionase family DNA binding protein
MPKSMGDDWLGVPGAARYIGVYQRTIYKLIDRGEIPAFKIGRVFRIRRADLDDFLERSRVRPGDLAHLYPPDYEEPDGDG